MPGEEQEVLLCVHLMCHICFFLLVFVGQTAGRQLDTERINFIHMRPESLKRETDSNLHSKALRGAQQEVKQK